jgi:hypothetical protein
MEFEEKENPKILRNPIQVVKNVKSEKDMESEEEIQTRTERFRRSRKGLPVKKKNEPEPSKRKKFFHNF